MRHLGAEGGVDPRAVGRPDAETEERGQDDRSGEYCRREDDHGGCLKFGPGAHALGLRSHGAAIMPAIPPGSRAPIRNRPEFSATKPHGGTRRAHAPTLPFLASSMQISEVDGRSRSKPSRSERWKTAGPISRPMSPPRTR